jgi:hypothetical protein
MDPLYPRDLKPLVSEENLPLVRKCLLGMFQHCHSPESKKAFRKLCTELLGSPLETERLLGPEDPSYQNYLSHYRVTRHSLSGGPTELPGQVVIGLFDLDSDIISVVAKFDRLAHGAYEVYSMDNRQTIQLDSLGDGSAAYTLRSFKATPIKQ